MTLEQALQITDQVFANTQGDRAMHVRLQEVAQVLRGELLPPKAADGKPKPENGKGKS